MKDMMAHRTQPMPLAKVDRQGKHEGTDAGYGKLQARTSNNSAELVDILADTENATNTFIHSREDIQEKLIEQVRSSSMPSMDVKLVAIASS